MLKLFEGRLNETIEELKNAQDALCNLDPDYIIVPPSSHSPAVQYLRDCAYVSLCDYREQNKLKPDNETYRKALLEVELQQNADYQQARKLEIATTTTFRELTHRIDLLKEHLQNLRILLSIGGT